METVEESKAEILEELELKGFELGEDTMPVQCQFADKMQKAFNDWESKQKEVGKRRAHHYPKNSQRTQQRHKKTVKDNEKKYKGNIVSLLLKAGVCHVIQQEMGHRSPCFRHRKES
jgi:homoaconitase/3-isopropylmalate dehydratase large subunit